APPSRASGLLARASSCCEQLVPARELDARTALRRAVRLLDCVDRLPAGVRDDLNSPVCEQLVDTAGPPLGKTARSGVLEQELDRLRRVLLIRPDHARRAALDPPCAVEARNRLAVLAEHTPTRIRDRARTVGEGDSRKAHAAVADAPKDDPARNDLALV